MIELIKCSVGLVYNQSSIMSEKNELVFLKRDKFPYKDVYELPGGKLENGESPQDALIRELYEEIGVEQSQIISIQKHPAFIHHYDNFQVRLYVFTVKLMLCGMCIPCRVQVTAVAARSPVILLPKLGAVLGIS